MGAVTGTIPFFPSDDDDAISLPFAQWLLRTIKKKADNEEEDLAYAKGESERHLYVWYKSHEVVGKGADHFRDREHLHLIDQDTDVDISTKTVDPPTTRRDGTYEKATAESKASKHHTGTKAINRGTSLPITVCTRNAPPDVVVEWQRNLIAYLRKETLGWLRDAGATEEQLREFLA
ncbi:hypothetical protein [Saccharothrix sp.]|uniref:hypothetical protein n=1 Tax=Saccharothrix sp. TaxID=1873460 RepID=UPI0028122D14|nr:hypothetical protein [Saccharothrix sp.]